MVLRDMVLRTILVSNESPQKTDNLLTSDTEKTGDDGYYPGLVNISGTYCFMNSTLQVRNAPGCTALQPFITLAFTL